MRAARATGRGRRSGIAALGALWAALASTGDHLLAVNASPARLGRRPGNRGRGGGGEIKERVRLGVGTGGRGGGGAQFCRLHPGTGQAGWRGMTTTGDDRTPLLAAPRPLPRAAPTRGGWSLQKPEAQRPSLSNPPPRCPDRTHDFLFCLSTCSCRKPCPELAADSSKRAGPTLPNSCGHLRVRS